MKVNVILNGMKEVEAALEHARECFMELENAISGVYTAMGRVGVEITQPLDTPEAE